MCSEGRHCVTVRVQGEQEKTACSEVNGKNLHRGVTWHQSGKKKTINFEARQGADHLDHPKMILMIFDQMSSPSEIQALSFLFFPPFLPFRQAVALQ